MIHMLSLSVTAGDDSAAIDIPDDDTIEEVHLSMWLTGAVVDGTTWGCQLSFGSQAAFSTNDARQVISQIYNGYELTTSGAAPTGSGVVVHPSVKVFGGERLYLHATATAGTINCRALVYTKSPGTARATRRT